MKKQYDDDDGRTIVNMNVEGMPWYRPEQPGDASASEGGSKLPDWYGKDELSKEGKRSLMRGVLGASMLITMAFAVGLGLFILFCVLVWFK